MTVMVEKIEMRPGLLAAVFLGSLSVLLFEMAQIRVFSYSLPPILAYSGISLAMTGFGIGAMLLSLAPSLIRRNIYPTLAVVAILQTVSMAGSSAIFAAASWNSVLHLNDNILELIFGILVPCTAPYFFGGLFLAMIFSSIGDRIGKVYFWNLFGSGVGAVLITVLLTPIGAERVIAAAGVMSALCAVILSLKAGSWVKGGAFLSLIGAVVLYPYSVEVFPFQPDPMDVTGMAMRSAEAGTSKPIRKEFDEWNIVGRIEIWRQEGSELSVPEKADYRSLTVDSGASTVLAGDTGVDGWGRGLFRETSYGLAYQVNPQPEDVLVIGTGGGIDVQAALHWGASDVTAVEINTTTIGALEGPYAQFLGWPKSQRASIVHADGRSFIKSPGKAFDVIQMSGVDTLTVYATGAFNMVEEYLYTVEAFEDYLRALKPGGVLGIVRFGAEHLRLTAIAAEALRRAGIDDPRNCIAAFKQSTTATILVKKDGFDANELDLLAAAGARKQTNGVSIPAYEMFGLYLNKPINIFYLPGRRTTPKFEALFRGMKEGDLSRVFPDDEIAIPTDDNPFFMLSGWIQGAAQTPIRNNVKLLKSFWLATIVLALVLIVVPVVIFGKKLPSKRPLLWVFPYFFLVGISFMMFEVGIINWFSIFVGSPGASTAVVLTSVLFASGIGSYTSEMGGMKPEVRIALAVVGLVVTSLLMKLLSPVIFNGCWSAGLGQVTRGLVAGLMIAPMGYAMGWFFPAGLELINRRMADARLVPWAISINGFASVVGSVAALPITIFGGFSYLFFLALAGYLIAGAVSSVFLWKKAV